MKPKIEFVWWGDGYFVYQDGHYVGKDDQVNFVTDLLVPLGAEVRSPSPEDLEAVDYDPDSAYELKDSDNEAE